MRLPIAAAIKFWSVTKSFSGAETRREMERPVALALVGSSEDQDRVIARLAREPGSSAPPADLEQVVRRYADPLSARESQIAIIIDSGDAADRSDEAFATLLSQIAAQHPDIRVSLASKVPAFRPVVIGQLTAETAKENGRVAALSALPGIIPLTDWLVPAAAAGDMYILTRNQVTLLLRIGGCYGLPPDINARLRELLPVVGSAFGWRAIARELVSLVPGGVGVVVKSTIAYAGTVTIGRAAAYYYRSGGHALTAAQMRRLYRDSLSDSIHRVRARLPVGRK